MIRFLKLPALPALLACALLQGPAAICAESPDNSTPLFSDPVVATGKGFEIKRSQVDDAFINYSASMAANGNPVSDADRPMIRSKLLDHLIVDKILTQKATADDKTAIQKLVNEELDYRRTNAPSPGAFEQQVKATGMTLEELRAKLQEERLCQRILARETTNGIVIPEVDVKKFYENNPDKFKMPELVRAAHILISTIDPVTRQAVSPEVKKEKLKLATELKARAEKGEDFVALVRKYSDDPGSKDKGGEYTFKRGQMVMEFEDAAFSMKTNQISAPVETKFGYHIIKLLEKRPSYTVEFAKAQQDIHDYLLEQAAEKVLPGYLDKIKAAADVKILDPDGAKAGAGKTPSTVK